ncbi:hypothetical protein HUW51_22870 [Adhaeribacter swui]|uniref:Uncharacterized protein n=1 Tax=Adhaeribacter swui TaxID=2086471 RepID=A0A7G7GE31_9BACT|nr:hypothetical protein [Adhaeribacter swui]QNF35415.1 hypothetical protein HUW51_22870 [Adhaeribacter swui]
MKAFIHNIPEPPSFLSDKIELRGNVYDDAGQLYKSDELIATLTNNTENWHWHVHIPNGKLGSINKGECPTYHEAFNEVNAYLDQATF